MPTYILKYSNLNLSSVQKKKVAEGITKVHSSETGANNYFAQVIFQKNGKNLRSSRRIVQPQLMPIPLDIIVFSGRGHLVYIHF